jgi:hypothetical protein
MEVYPVQKKHAKREEAIEEDGIHGQKGKSSLNEWQDVVLCYAREERGIFGFENESVCWQ